MLSSAVVVNTTGSTALPVKSSDGVVESVVGMIEDVVLDTAAGLCTVGGLETSTPVKLCPQT